MVEIDVTNDSEQTIRLTPNRSASWVDTKYLMLTMVFFVMVIAIAWAFVGAWVILPFAGIEVGLLAYIMYRVSHSTYRAEEIKITRSLVTLSKGRLPLKRFKEQHQFARNDLHIEVIETENDWHLPDIRLVTPTKALSVGAFLNLSDRKTLSSHLRTCGIPNCRTHWWKND